MLFLSLQGGSEDTAHTSCDPPLLASGEGLRGRGEGSWKGPTLLGSNQLGRPHPWYQEYGPERRPQISELAILL